MCLGLFVTATIVAQDVGIRENGKVQRGYKCFLKMGEGVSFGNYLGEGYYHYGPDTDGTWATAEFTTTHGCQIIPQLFVGGGLGLFFGYPFGNSDNDEWLYAIPIYSEIRYTPIHKMVTPTIGMRLGYTHGFDEAPNPQGLYFNPSFGVRIGFKKRFALDFSLDYILQRQNTLEDYRYYEDESYFLNSLHLGIALEF